jgi:hypothetical protein
MLDLATYEYWNTSPTASATGIPSGANYADFTWFGAGQPIGVHLEPFLDNTALARIFQTLLPNEVVFDAGSYYSNTIGAGSYFNTWTSAWYNQIGQQCILNAVGAGFELNTIGPAFTTNSIGALCKWNILGVSFSANRIGSEFTTNVIGANFFEAKIGNLFSFNIIGGSFAQNTIGAGGTMNNIGSNVTGNTAEGSFQYNNIASGITNVDFTGASHVYAAYNCDIFVRSDTTYRLSYVDGSDVVQYVAPTA